MTEYGFTDVSDSPDIDLANPDQQYIQDMGVIETVGVATAGILTAQSVLVTAMAAPVYAGIMGATAGGLVYAGYRKRKDLPLVPSFVKEATDTTPAPIVDTTGTPVAVASL